MTAQAGDTSSAAARKAALRRQALANRRLLSAAVRTRAALRALKHLRNTTWFREARRVAVYLSTGSELSTAPVVRALLARGIHVYAPRLAAGRMEFTRLRFGTPLRANPHRILEPAAREARRSAARMDLVLVPLAAFDARGHRLGMGAGYYDRALAFRRPGRRPLLLGYAYAAQELPAIPQDAHDVKLDAVVTERGAIRFFKGS